MININVDASEVLAVLQQMFPNEYTICLQRVHIAKLEALIEEKSVEQTANPPDSLPSV
jgi:hypothetical protein